jgi:hypothetical protein
LEIEGEFQKDSTWRGSGKESKFKVQEKGRRSGGIYNHHEYE